MQKWWEQEKPHDAILGVVKYLDESQSARAEANLRYIRLYGNNDMQGLGYNSYSRLADEGRDSRVTLNVIQSCVDSAAAKIAKNRPRPLFLTEGGDYSLQKKAKQLNKFVEGQFYATRAYEKATKCFIDAGITGTGIMKIYADGSEICVERVLPNEIVLDDRDALYGNPRCIYQCKTVNRDVLKGMYPDAEVFIDQASSSKSGYGLGYYDPAQDADQVGVVEAWHLPSSKGAKDGKHVICISGFTLFEEPYTKDFFPFAFIKWNQRPFGFFGQGIAEQLRDKQIEINKLLIGIQRAFHLGSGFTVFVEQGSKIVKSHFNNDIGNFVSYSGVKPTIEVFATVHPEIFAHLRWLVQSSYEEVGISQLSAQSKKPAGLDSGKALREYNDIESERFAIVGQAWEQFFLDIAAQLIECAKDIYKTDKNYSVMVREKKFLRSIKWADVNMEEDKYQMHCWPVSQLPSTPAGKLAAVQEMMQAGLIDPETGMQLLDFPDLERYQNLKFSARELIQDIVEKMVNEGEYTSPEPFMDLAYCVQYTQTVYNKAKLDNVPEENLELLRRFMEQAQYMAAPPPAEPVPQDPMMQQQPQPEMPAEQPQLPPIA